MPLKIEDYALIGDCETAALVGKDGSIDWLCLPRFDSGACFAALLGKPEHGRWLIAPKGEINRVQRHYRGNTLILETDFETPDGEVTLIDCMPLRTKYPLLIRTVRGKRGHVPMRMELIIRFDYGSIVPWVRQVGKGPRASLAQRFGLDQEEDHGVLGKQGIQATAGPDTLQLWTDADLRGEGYTTVADFTVAPGQEVPFVLAWHPSHEEPPAMIEPGHAVQDTDRWWQEWSNRCTYRGPWRDAVLRSLITLNALIYAPTGGIIAAPTTSLPEQLGGVRNWDYRYCWLRDTTFTLYALMAAGYKEEALAWRQWLLRAVAGNPAALQIMYGLAGERRLTEFILDWLPGYEGAKPVRVGNAASNQFQLDVYGELLDSMYQARRVGLESEEAEWRVELAILEFLEKAWDKPDEGIWEVRGPRQHFTHSKMMAWVAFDRAVKAVENFGLEGPVDNWRKIRAAIHEQVCSKGFNTSLGAFVQYYGANELDASLLMMPLVGFLPPDDPRIRGTVEAIERTLVTDGFVARYATASSVDGLPGGEGAFLACTFWLADNQYLLGRHADAVHTFKRLLELRNDVGLLSEEYDPHAQRLVGNFPQAFSHIGLINTAMNLSPAEGPAEHRMQT